MASQILILKSLSKESGFIEGSVTRFIWEPAFQSFCTYKTPWSLWLSKEKAFDTSLFEQVTLSEFKGVK